MVHDAGPATGRLERLRARFPDADAVVFGHSHIPLHERARRLPDLQPRQPDRPPAPAAHTMGVLDVSRGTGRLAFRHLVVDPPR